MLFHLLHHNTYFDNYVKCGEYTKSPIFTHHGRSFWELKGKKFGIIGLGTIGRRVAELARAFGCDVSYYSTSGKNRNTNYQELPLTDLLNNSDIISIHCPLNADTLNLIDEKELRQMKSSSYLLNLGRGGIVNETVLVRALEEKQIAGAGVDVLTEEPIRSNSPLLRCKYPERLFITPHIAWASVESRTLLIEKLISNIRQFLKQA
jgi:glycerate dehydrogenase